MAPCLRYFRLFVERVDCNRFAGGHLRLVPYTQTIGSIGNQALENSRSWGTLCVKCWVAEVRRIFCCLRRQAYITPVHGSLDLFIDCVNKWGEHTLSPLGTAETNKRASFSSNFPHLDLDFNATPINTSFLAGVYAYLKVVNCLHESVSHKAGPAQASIFFVHPCIRCRR